MYKIKAKGYQIRARAQWVEEGEKSTKYFLNLENFRQTSNCINCLKDCNKNYVHTDEEILKVSKNYYASLYKEKSLNEHEIDNFFASITPKKQLNEALKQECEGIFTFDECSYALGNMKKNKSPGLDGISIEFYIKFWPLIGNLLLKVFNESYNEEILPESQRTSIMTLIFKKGDTCDIGNYRPISLTNVDYRIMAFILAERLQRVIDSVVSQDQTAYIRNRFMGNNIRLIEDVIEHFDKLDKKGLLFMIDFQKAFDSLQWNFMFKTLEFFNFGPSFTKWIKLLYTLPVSKVKNNGYLSEEFSISSGIRQGCPVSALLFILSIEMLGLRIRQEKELKGFDFGLHNNAIKTVQYADDCILLLNDTNEICTALSILEDFDKLSGLKLNLSKCEGLWLGSDKYRQNRCSLFGIKWPEQLRYLGIYIGHNKDKNMEMNWLNKIERVRNILNNWKRRELSLFGKIQLIKTFAISQFVLPATSLVVPQNIIKDIETIVYKLLWGKKDKVKRLRVVQELKNGGLNMVDIRSIFMSFKAAWVARILRCNPIDHRWSQLAHFYLQPLLDCKPDLIFNFDDTVHFHQLRYLSQFYQDVIISYNKAFVTEKDGFLEDIADHCLWGNKFFVTKRKNKKMVLFLRNWIRSGVNYVRDLKFVDGKLDENFVYQTISMQGNIFSEVMIVKKALKPYREYLKHLNVETAVHKQIKKFTPRRSKDFYIRYRTIISKEISVMTKYLNGFCDNDDVSYIFVNKIVSEKEIKFKEFNFKLLHGMLPCNKNLKSWKLKSDDACDVCQQQQSIEHLLFDCTYVKPLWNMIERVCDFHISFNKILGIDECNKQDRVLTLISFLIYKEWLLLSLENKKRSNSINFAFYREELMLRYKIYERCTIYDPTDIAFIDVLICMLP